MHKIPRPSAKELGLEDRLYLSAHGSNLCALYPSGSSFFPQMVSDDDDLPAPPDDASC